MSKATGKDLLEDLWLALRCMGQKGVTKGTSKQLKERVSLLHWACDYLMGYTQDLQTYNNYLESVLDDAQIDHDDFMEIFGHHVNQPHDPKNKITGFQTIYITPEAMEDILSDIFDYETYPDNDDEDEYKGEDLDGSSTDTDEETEEP